MKAQASALDGGGWSTPRPGRFTPGKQRRYPLHRRLGRPQGRSRRIRKLSPPPGFDPRTVQPVASRNTDWAIAAHTCNLMTSNLIVITKGPYFVFSYRPSYNTGVPFSYSKVPSTSLSTAPLNVVILEESAACLGVHRVQRPRYSYQRHFNASFHGKFGSFSLQLLPTRSTGILHVWMLYESADSCKSCW